jgi:hypothetical protein
MHIHLRDGVYSHLEHPQLQAEVILASSANTGSPNIYTIRLRYPRPIHGEIMTHRVFGRNARSSRAVPVKTMLDEVRRIPYVPWHWGKNQKGMQANEECQEIVSIRNFHNDIKIGKLTDHTAKAAWLAASERACEIAEAYMMAGYHKQNPNRLLEPFSWIDTLITATDWKNFLWLRQHHAAEPHLQDLANLTAKAINNAEVQNLASGDWHLPYITEDDWHAAPEKNAKEWLCKISAARCARISYKPFNGDSSFTAELDRYNLLVTDERVHASPLEHQATPDTISDGKWDNPELHGNLTAWIQHRKMVPNEVYLG